jgi:hypothetical protein
MLNAHIGYGFVVVIEGPVPKTLLERSDVIGSVAIYLEPSQECSYTF